jgi:hypothetical protein
VLVQITFGTKGKYFLLVTVTVQCTMYIHIIVAAPCVMVGVATREEREAVAVPSLLCLASAGEVAEQANQK